jgi:hypothetical protein
MVDVNLPMLAAWDRSTKPGRTVLDSISERHFQRAVIAAAEDAGWKVHWIDSTATRQVSGLYRGLGPKGWPDLFMVRGDRAIAAELKTEKTSPSAEQKAWLQSLDGLPCVETRIWKPRDARHILATLR